MQLVQEIATSYLAFAIQLRATKLLSFQIEIFPFIGHVSPFYRVLISGLFLVHCPSVLYLKLRDPVSCNGSEIMDVLIA